MKNKNTLWTVVGIVAIVIVISIVKMSHKTIVPLDQPPAVAPTEMVTPETPAPAPTTAPTPAPKKTSPAPRPSPTPIPVYSGKVTVSIQNYKFYPANITIKEGTVVVWKNNDTVEHQVVEDGGNFGPKSWKLAPGDGYPFTFPNAGVFTYHCELHPSMTGTVTVVK